MTDPNPQNQPPQQGQAQYSGQSQYPGHQYPSPQNLGPQNLGPQNLGPQYPGQPQYQGQPQYPGQPQYQGQPQYPGQQYPGQQYPGQQYPGQPQPGWAAPGVAVGPAPTLNPVVSYLAWGMVAVCVLVVLAANMTWVSLGPISVSGTAEGKDGWITLSLGVIVALVALASALIRKPSGIHLAAGIVGVIGGLLVTAVGIIDIADVNDKGFTVGGGLIFTLIAGIALLCVGVAAIVKRR